MFIHQINIANFGTTIVYFTQIIFSEINTNTIAPIKVRQSRNLFQGATA